MDEQNHEVCCENQNEPEEPKKFTKEEIMEIVKEMFKKDELQ